MNARQQPQPPKNWLKGNLGSIIMFCVFLVFLYAFMGGTTNTTDTKPTISQMITDVRAGNIESIEDAGDHATATYKIDDEKTPGKKKVVEYAKRTNQDVLEILQNSGIDKVEELVKITYAEAGGLAVWLSIISTLGPILLTLFIIFILFRQMGGGGGGALSFGKSRGKLTNGKGAFDPDKNRPTSFEDVAGIEEAKQELVEVVEFLKNPKKFTNIGARIPHGVLLIGGPGSGKTLLAKAVAGEAGVPFFTMSGSEFVEMFVGVGASRARDLFDQAKKSAPCIIFIDEIDAVGRQRGTGMGGGHDEREQTLNQILIEMDGFDSKTTVIVIAATNRPDVLDPALLRPGRFDRQIILQKPDIKGREAILKVHLNETIKKHLDKEVDMEVIAKQTPGFSGADLRNLVNEAAILAARSQRNSIIMQDFEEAIDRVIAGPARKSKIMTEDQKRHTAYHEVGHAIVGHYLPNADPVHKISIISRGMMGGYTRFLPTEDKDNYTRSQFKDMIATLLAGYAIEQLQFGDISTGASNDIERATALARSMVTKYGMSEKFGPVAIGNGDDQMVFLGRELGTRHTHSDHLAAQVDDEIHAIINDGLARSNGLLKKHRAVIDVIAERIVDTETMESDEFLILLGEKPKEKVVKVEAVVEEDQPKKPVRKSRKAKTTPLLSE